MNRIVRYRGPDDEGFAVFSKDSVQCCGGTDTPESVYRSDAPWKPQSLLGNGTDFQARAAFAHRRLSILDLSPHGHQPMSREDGRYWICFNGEIYNYRELRVELEGCGERFHSTSDTEIILAAYNQWGEECFKRFRGMWAFAIYDHRRQTIVLSRDRFGIKPLYYWLSPGGIFAFASEIKQFSVLSGWRAVINAQRAFDYLAFGLTDHTDETLFHGVFQLPPGHALTLPLAQDLRNSQGRFAAKRWYSLSPEIRGGSDQDAVSEFKRRFFESVEIHLRADVPIGSCLSGGLDSSSIVCTMNRQLAAQNAEHLQKTFSAGSHIPKYDERQWIEHVIKATGVQPHYVVPALDNLWEVLPQMVFHQDEPFASTSVFAQWKVFELAKQNGVTVMLDGQGADEILAGYPDYFTCRHLELLSTLRWGQLRMEIKQIQALHHIPWKKSLIALARAAKQAVAGRKEVPWILPGIDFPRLGCKPVRFEHACGIPCPASIRDLSLSQIMNTNLPMLLHWEDRNSMASSIEARVPFLDHPLVELALGLPSHLKISGGITKHVLRQSMTGVLPEPVRSRIDKMGFVTAFESWIRDTPDVFRSKLRESIDSSGGIITTQSIAELDAVISGAAPADNRIWRMICFGTWIRIFSLSVS